MRLSIEPWHGISNNVVCATSKASDQPAHTRSLIRAFASRLIFYECAQARPSLHLSKCHIVGNHMSRLNNVLRCCLMTIKGELAIAPKL